MDIIQCLKISLQLDLEVSNTHSIEKDNIHHLCSAFSFWYETFSPDENTFHAYIYFPKDNFLCSADYMNIIKTFALLHGYYILNSKIVEIDCTDNVCLDE